jgi:hypothetical protein
MMSYLDFERFFHLLNQLDDLIRMKPQTFGVDLPKLINQLFKRQLIVAESAHKFNLPQKTLQKPTPLTTKLHIGLLEYLAFL